MRPALLAALALTVAVPAASQLPTSPPGKADTKAVVTGVYAIDAAHTQVLFTVNHLGFSEYSGQFIQPSGKLTLDSANPSKTHVEVSFPIAKVVSTDPALDAHLQKPEFFDSARFPEGRFVSTKVAWKKGSATAMIDGNLTLKGVTRPVTLKTRFVGAGPMVMGPPKLNIGFAATTSIKRSDFGISYGIPLVSDRVDLTINAAFAAE